MEESHKTHRPHIKVGKDEEKKKKTVCSSSLIAFALTCHSSVYEHRPAGMGGGGGVWVTA